MELYTLLIKMICIGIFYILINPLEGSKNTMYSNKTMTSDNIEDEELNNQRIAYDLKWNEIIELTNDTVHSSYYIGTM